MVGEAVAVDKMVSRRGAEKKMKKNMSDDGFEDVEQQIAAGRLPGAQSLLRARVLDDSQRELRAARWDRRLARAAAVLLIVGVGLNLVNALGSSELDQQQQTRVAADVRPSIVDTAISVAQASDTTTAHRIARQIAAMTGHKLTAAEEAAIDAATRTSRGISGNRG